MVTQGSRSGQNGTGATQAAAATGLTRAATATWEGPGGEAMVCYYLFLLFLYFHLFFVPLFFFSDNFFSDEYNNGQATKEKYRMDGTGYTRAAIATWDGTEGASGANRYICVYFLSFLLSSFFLSFSFFQIVSFLVEYNSRRARRDRPTRAVMPTLDRTREQAGLTGTSSVTDFLPTLLFSSSRFYYLFCRKL